MTAGAVTDYARDIVEHFLGRRERGSAISSADQQLIGDWELRGVPLFCVFEGIERAYERRREPPRSLADCRRWVHAAWRTWAGAETEAASSTSVAAQVTQAAPASLADRAQELLRVELAVAREPALRAALAGLAAEVDEIVAEEGGLDAVTAASLDEAVAELIIAELPDHERAAVEADIRLEERLAQDAAVSPADAARRVARASFDVVSRRFGLRSLSSRL